VTAAALKRDLADTRPVGRRRFGGRPTGAAPETKEGVMDETNHPPTTNPGEPSPPAGPADEGRKLQIIIEPDGTVTASGPQADDIVEAVALLKPAAVPPHPGEGATPPPSQCGPPAGGGPEGGEYEFQTEIDADDDGLGWGAFGGGSAGADAGYTSPPPPFPGPPLVTNPFGPADPDPYVRQVADWLRVFVAPGQVTELRALDAVTPGYRRPHTVSGYFDSDHLEEMALHALELSGGAKGVYFTFNPLQHDLLSRRCNRVDDAADTTPDNDVLVRRWLFIDFDPHRVSGVSASDQEKARAWAKAVDVRGYLGSLGWPAPVVGDSGNGYHLLYRVDLPADDGGLVQRVLHALADWFDDWFVKIDRAVYNPARIVKLYGTLARKGDNTPERPHRWSGVVQVPGPLEAVPLDKVAALAARAPAPAEGPREAPRAGGPQPPGAVESKALAYLETLPPAVSGDGGHDRTFHAASVLTQGFALTPQQALPLLRQYNERCQPPWSDDELRHKLEGAAKKEGPRGYLLGPAPAGGPQAPGGFRADFLDCAALEDAAVKPRWLVTKALVAGQPAVVGGPKKSLKTSLVIDLAVSLAGGRPFLGAFQVPQAVPVLLLSGESGQAAVLDAARRVCQAKGLKFRECGALLWGFRLPRLSCAADLATLAAALRARGTKVVIIDPLYLCMLAGSGGEGIQASNMFQMGPLLLDVAEACLGAGATPVLVHHTRKQNQVLRGRDSEPLDLEDLAYSGVAEFARQWLLVSRREKFDPEVGEHKLWLAVGGSAGHAGLYGVDVREGSMSADFGGRQWRVTVQPASKAVQAARLAKEEQKKQAQAAKRAADEEKVLAALNKSFEGKTAPDIADASGVGVDTARVILHEQLLKLTVVRCKVKKNFGTGKKVQEGWLLWRGLGKPLSNEQRHRLREGDFVEDVLGVEAVNGLGAVQPKEGG
jgi:replicative DNA helicase